MLLQNTTYYVNFVNRYVLCKSAEYAELNCMHTKGNYVDSLNYVKYLKFEYLTKLKVKINKKNQVVNQ
jgi:hypothetical protein